MTRTIHTFASCLMVGDTIVDTYDNRCSIVDIIGDDNKMRVGFDQQYNGRWVKEFRGIDCVRMLIHTKDAELNKLYLKCQLSYFNDLLHARGHVFLNEVYDALGFERTAPGALMGWSSPNIGAVSFGDLEKQRVMNDFVLNFNIQGTVFDKLPGDWEMP